MANIICKLVGHKTTPGYNDSGFLICHRCGSHEFYHHCDGIWLGGGLLLRPYYFFRWVFYQKVYYPMKHLIHDMFYKDNLPF